VAGSLKGRFRGSDWRGGSGIGDGLGGDVMLGSVGGRRWRRGQIEGGRRGGVDLELDLGVR
jgi:hypothetical protein